MALELPFSKKYDAQHSADYYNKHQASLARRLSNWRDQQLARKALQIANDPQLVLDLPCGAGRFWQTLCEKNNRVIMAADNSFDMLHIAQSMQPHAISSRVTCFQTSAFNIDLPDNAVDNIFCMRLLHHISDPAHRASMLKEMHRVTRDTVIISLWVDGNVKALRRKQLEAKRAKRNGSVANQNRFVVSAKTIEQEFKYAGFDVIKHLDFLPLYSMWRVYILKKTEY